MKNSFKGSLMRSVEEINQKIKNMEGQKSFFESIDADIQGVDLNISRINLCNTQIGLLKWILDGGKEKADIRERLIQALNDFGVRNEMYNETNESLADYLIEVIEELR